MSPDLPELRLTGRRAEDGPPQAAARRPVRRLCRRLEPVEKLLTGEAGTGTFGTFSR